MAYFLRKFVSIKNHEMSYNSMVKHIGITYEKEKIVKAAFNATTELI